ncbi:hypothetical protein O181_053189 [Austropuccinia psidii MF-1]|uniref:Uncharacterized protein n=1 Tax=Austropuccinia psidii MF-1 TaxID=1389203 RepID=A0A9Q3HSE4_9BASI|nr:hypothetical protein [Austropuccinia psidii MF-1]
MGASVPSVSVFPLSGVPLPGAHSEKSEVLSPSYFHEVDSNTGCYFRVISWVAFDIINGPSAEAIYIGVAVNLLVYDGHIASILPDVYLPPQHVSIGSLHIQ